MRKLINALALLLMLLALIVAGGMPPVAMN